MPTEDYNESDGMRARTTNFVNDHFIAIMVAPAVVSIFVIFIYPVLNLFWISMHEFVLATGGYARNFVFLENFIEILSTSSFWNSFATTLLYAFGSLAISLSAGLVLALAVNHVTSAKLRTLYVTLILTVWASPFVVGAMMWGWILNTELGLLNMIITDLGGSNLPWLADQTLAMVSVIVVDAWIRTPFAMLIILAGLQAIPPHMYDATKIDGATTFQAFRNVTIPYLKPTFAIVVLINWMFAFRAFGVVWTLTRGGPGSATRVLAVDIYDKGVGTFSLGDASAVSVILVTITLGVAAFVFTKVMVRVEDQ